MLNFKMGNKELIPAFKLTKRGIYRNSDYLVNKDRVSGE